MGPRAGCCPRRPWGAARHALREAAATGPAIPRRRRRPQRRPRAAARGMATIPLTGFVRRATSATPWGSRRRARRAPRPWPPLRQPARPRPRQGEPPAAGRSAAAEAIGPASRRLVLGGRLCAGRSRSARAAASPEARPRPRATAPSGADASDADRGAVAAAGRDDGGGGARGGGGGGAPALRAPRVRVRLGAAATEAAVEARARARTRHGAPVIGSWLLLGRRPLSLRPPGRRCRLGGVWWLGRPGGSAAQDPVSNE